MSESENESLDVGTLIAEAAEAGDAEIAENLIRSNNFIVFQQISAETGEVEKGEDGSFSVVLVEIDDDTAVVCFSNEQNAAAFAKEIVEDAGEEMAEGEEIPSTILEGGELLDGLPPDCGLLMDAGAESECYFPPGCFEEADDEAAPDLLA
ncbi:hypothetical protein [Aureliella helgolandensis]|uniref:SseB protein N-terminal domain-containing protein n=1 Tax=Aureliella helgolandensis TaxID=2527968 RepID=A0A518G2M5_9BACT|nr:hypothetical protein [Aureliella helgolandensis]QDV22805.1 hypothetical protein Q31a_10960 [Aureliella helgolandensis]